MRARQPGQAPDVFGNIFIGIAGMIGAGKSTLGPAPMALARHAGSGYVEHRGAAGDEPPPRIIFGNRGELVVELDGPLCPAPRHTNSMM
jgi:hypothetical protein